MIDTTTLKGKKVLVTGGAGFIGSHLCDALVQAGADVTSVDSFIAGKAENLAHLAGKPNFRSVKKDIIERTGWDELFDGVSYVFNNAASKKNVCLVDPRLDLEVNGGGTLNMLELARKHGVKRFIHASTGSVYGEPTIFPTTESHPFAPVSYYGVSKLAGERYVHAFHHLYGMETVILRYFHVYGPRQESNEFGGVVTIFLRNILENRPVVISGDGQQERSFTYVRDIVEANLRVATSPVAPGKAYNVASGIKVSIQALAEFLAQVSGGKAQFTYGPPLIGDILRFDVSNDLIVRDTGITFNTDFWGTLKSSLDEFKSYLPR